MGDPDQAFRNLLLDGFTPRKTELPQEQFQIVAQLTFLIAQDWSGYFASFLAGYGCSIVDCRVMLLMRTVGLTFWFLNCPDCLHTRFHKDVFLAHCKLHLKEHDLKIVASIAGCFLSPPNLRHLILVRRQAIQRHWSKRQHVCTSLCLACTSMWLWFVHKCTTQMPTLIPE